MGRGRPRGRPQAPGKQHRTARRIYDRLVAERGYAGSCSAARRFVRGLRLARVAPCGGVFLELEWAPGICQVDFGNFRTAVGERALDLKLLIATLPHSNDRQCAALMSQRPGGRARPPPPSWREWPGLGAPKQAKYLAGHLEAERPGREASERTALLRRYALPVPKTFDGYDWSAVS